MNVFVLELSRKELADYGQSNRIKIEDNVGESVHLHYKNIRKEFTVKDYLTFAENVEYALEEINNGD